MKINGQSLSDGYVRQVELPRPDGSSLMLSLRPLSLGFHRRLRSRGILMPTAPTRVARDANGRPMRDERGMAVLTGDDTDERYRAELETYHQRVAVLAVAEALHADSTIEFETAAPAADGDWRQYADDLYGELERSGWTAGDLVWLCHEVCRLSNLVGDDLAESQRNFLSERRGERASPSV